MYNPRCRGSFSRWGQGNYTLIRDDDQEQAEYALDLRMCFNVSSSEESEAGGQTVYIARGEDEELVTVTPEENTLSLVYRYVGVTQQILRLGNVSSYEPWEIIQLWGIEIFQTVLLHKFGTMQCKMQWFFLLCNILYLLLKRSLTKI